MNILSKVTLLSLLLATNNAVGATTPVSTVAGSDDILPPYIRVLHPTTEMLLPTQLGLFEPS